MIKKLIIFLILSFVLAGCSQSDTLADLPSANLGLESVILADGDTYDLVASQVKVMINGEDQEMLAYNGSIPGPTIFVEQGSKIYLNFKNEIGDDSSLHSHGLRLANEFDGVPGLTQDEVPNLGVFNYELSFPDVGVYFYHPHTREDYQQDAGLYGAFVVLPTDKTENEFGVQLSTDHQLVFLDDLEVNYRGGVELSRGSVTKTLMGRFGNKMFINGEFDRPLDWSTLTEKQSVLVTFVNTSNVRPYNLKVDGAKMELVADDASAYQQIEEIGNLIVGPSERFTVKFTFELNNDFTLYSQANDRARKYIIAQSKIGSALQAMDIDLNGLKLDSSLLNDLYDLPVSKELELDMDMLGMHGGHGMAGMPCHQMPDGSWMGDCDESLLDLNANNGVKIEFEDEMLMMNAQSNIFNVDWIMRDKRTGLEGGEIDWEFNVGDYVKIKVENLDDSMHPMQHPFHVHGQRFLVLEKNGVKNSNLAWQDTVLIPSGDTYELVVEMSNVGDWLIHCHIPEHMEAGMMMKFKVM